MIEEFVIAARPQKAWSWLIPIAFFLGGVGAGLFLLSLYLGLTEGLALGLAVVALGTNAAFLLDLGRPQRFWRVFTHPLTSWISRGALLILIFLGLGILYLAPTLPGLSSLPWREGTALGRALQVLTALAALGVMTYAGFVLSHSPAIPFWNTTLLPILFVLYALMGGTAALFALLPFLEEGAVDLRLIETLEVYLLLGALLLLLVYLMTMFTSTLAARESARLLLRGSLALPFLGGVVLIGLLVPLAIALSLYFAGTGFATAAPVLFVMGLLELAGGLLFRYCLVRAGVYAPVL